MIAGALGSIGKNMAATDKLEAAADTAGQAATAAAKAAMSVGMKLKMGGSNRQANITPTGGSAKRMEALEIRMGEIEATFSDTDTKFGNLASLLKDTRAENKVNTNLINEVKS